jgi:nicotinamidase-related amidase
MGAGFGFFDADCRELDELGDGLAYRPRVRPLAAKLERLYILAERRGYPLVFTTCCSGRMPAPASWPQVCQVPLDGTDTGWRESVGRFRQFYLAKRTCGRPEGNLACRYFDMFLHNANAAALLRMLAVGTWVVFGNGFDLCVGSAARGILDAGQNLILLEDVRIASARATMESEQATFDELARRGARRMTLEAFLALEAAA